MDTLNSSYITEQNKIASSGAWIWLLEITTSGYTPIRYANNNTTIGWPVSPGVPGHNYFPTSILMDDISESTGGEFPVYKLQIGDVDLSSTLRTRIKATSGLVGSMIRLRVVHSDHLDIITPAIDETSEILNCEVTANTVVFTIGIPSLLSRRFPRDRYVPSFCRHKFGGALCRYTQPIYTLTSNQISFVAGTDYNVINEGSGSLISSIFQHAPGDYSTIYTSRYVLTNDTVFIVSGSSENDGYFIANSAYLVHQSLIRVFTEADKAREFVAESAGQDITIQLGFGECDHTLEACALRNNTQNYGGSPGIVGGIYG